jgi:hypothetical protein
MRLSLLVLIPSLLVGGCGVTAPHSSEGYADLDSLGFADTDTTMTLSLGPAVLHRAAGFIEDDPEIRELLLNLEGVRVRTYRIVDGQERVAGRIDKMSKKLEKQGWEPVITVQEGGDRTRMLVRIHAQKIAGLTVFTLDSTEAVIVNVMGDLSPELFTDAMIALQVDVPEVQVLATVPADSAATWAAAPTAP